jgi:hypothetical protein
MSASKPAKEVKMHKARLISLMATLALLAVYLQGVFLGLPGSWFDGH